MYMSAQDKKIMTAVKTKIKAYFLDNSVAFGHRYCVEF